ncbi:MAG: tagaturonate reductase [Clostridia bacterium]|nr:tagaturonate reductase [Clostridia bacterium]MBQ8583705.1 tagaturonate reductase [Clostridia bacterium]
MNFEKTARCERVIQFGEGGFLRGFVDWMLQKVNEKSDFNGSVVVVQPIEQGMCDMLSAQNCVYTHVIRGVEGVDKTLVDVISRCVKPYEDFAGYLALAEQPEMRFVVSNTTESGIVFSDEDKITDAPPKTFPAKVTLLLKRRFELGLDGFIFLPCELIDRNGDNLKKCVLKYADLWGLSEDFKAWVNEKNVFTNTLVDRINTGYPKGEDMQLGYEDNMVNTSEFFHLWVIETDFDIEKELPFSSAGLNVIVTPDKLEMYRTRKVRILNGAHTSLVPYALLSGLDTVKSCIDDEVMNAHIRKCVFDEIIPTLDLPREELLSYANSVLERFGNPYIKHYLSSIALNSVSKFKVRVLPSILEYIKRYGKMPETLLFSFAKLIEFYKTDMVNDAPEVAEFMKNATTAEILANDKLWGEDLTRLLPEVEKYIK